MRVTLDWLGCATFRLNIGEDLIVFLDGYMDRVPSAPPVGQLVNEAVTTVSTTRAALVAVALPSPPDGQSWRLARDLDPKVLQQVSEAQVGKNVVIVFAATGPGTARIVFALTHGESSTVSRAVTQVVTVR